MHLFRRKPSPQTFDATTTGGLVGVLARKDLGMGRDAEKVAMAQGVGSAVEYVRRTKEQKRAARKRQRNARRVNR